MKTYGRKRRVCRHGSEEADACRRLPGRGDGVAACPGGFDDFKVDDKDSKRPEARTDGSMTTRSSLREILETIERLEAKGLVSRDELMEVKPMLERSIRMNEKDTAMEDTANRIYEMICARIDKNFEDLRSFVESRRDDSA